MTFKTKLKQKKKIEKIKKREKKRLRLEGDKFIDEFEDKTSFMRY